MSISDRQHLVDCVHVSTSHQPSEALVAFATGQVDLRASGAWATHSVLCGLVESTCSVASSEPFRESCGLGHTRVMLLVVWSCAIWREAHALHSHTRSYKLTGAFPVYLVPSLAMLFSQLVRLGS
jgi:hypothetical protein